MIRDFTEATKERLLKQIDDINKKDWNVVTDFLGDVTLYAGKFLGILSLNDDMSNVEKYQRNVLDMSNTTKKDLKKIFEKVYGVDEEYQGDFNELNTCSITYNQKITSLSEAMQPNFSICSSKKLKSMVADYNATLKNVGGKITANFEEEVDWASKRAALKSTKGIVTGLIKGAFDIVTLPVKMVKNVVTGNFVGIATDTWDIINDVFAVGSNAVGLASLGLLLIPGTNANQKNFALSTSEAYAGAEGLTDALEADIKVNGENFVNKTMKGVSQTIDLADATVGVVNTFKKLENPNDLFDSKFGIETKLKTLHKADMLEKYQDNYGKYQALYRKVAKNTQYVKVENISQGYDYLESFIKGLDENLASAFASGGKEVANSQNLLKFFIKGFDTGVDAWKYVENLAN